MRGGHWIPLSIFQLISLLSISQSTHATFCVDRHNGSFPFLIFFGAQSVLPHRGGVGEGEISDAQHMGRCLRGFPRMDFKLINYCCPLGLSIPTAVAPGVFQRWAVLGWSGENLLLLNSHPMSRHSAALSSILDSSFRCPVPKKDLKSVFSQLLGFQILLPSFPGTCREKEDKCGG